MKRAVSVAPAAMVTAGTGAAGRWRFCGCRQRRKPWPACGRLRQGLRLRRDHNPGLHRGRAGWDEARCPHRRLLPRTRRDRPGLSINGYPRRLTLVISGCEVNGVRANRVQGRSDGHSPHRSRV